MKDLLNLFFGLPILVALGIGMALGSSGFLHWLDPSQAWAVASATPTQTPVFQLGQQKTLCVVKSDGTQIPASGAGTKFGSCQWTVRIIGADGSVVDDWSSIK